uniref:TC1 domain-containing protein n=1 Tax=Macrostomum lignano TaxID=282301 RepID=A0A1I8IEU7_9PLAT
EMTAEVELAAAASAAQQHHQHHQQQRKASNAGSDDLLAPLPSNVGAGASHGRRMSRGRGRLGTLAGPSLMLGGGDHGARSGQPPPLENTYRLKPDESQRFNCRLATEILTAALETAVAGVGQKYDAERCRSACQSAAEQARRELRELDSRRYKLVVNVSIMQLLGQSAAVASRSVGNPETDNYATAQVSAGEFACVATVHALYYE